MNAAAVVALLLAVVTAGAGGAALPELLLRMKEGETFRDTLPTRRWIPAAIAAWSAGLLAVALSAYGWEWGLVAVMPAYVYLSVAGVAMGFVDMALMRLPDAFTLRSYPVVGALLSLGGLVVWEPRRLVAALVGMAVMGGLYFLLFIIYPPGMGFGDVKLSGVLGLALGFLGPQPVFIGLVAGFLIGSVVSLGVLVVRRSRDLKTNVPFGPSMLVGALVAAVLPSVLA